MHDETYSKESILERNENVLSIFIKEFIKQNLKQLTADDILYYGTQYGFSLSLEEASTINSLIKSSEFDPFQLPDREYFFNELAKITNSSTAQKAENLLYQIVQQYNLQHLIS